ncbi:MAG: thiamine pyrophosphate-binding protein, partial [Candidatus Zixiibacteriota bacterium]
LSLHKSNPPGQTFRFQVIDQTAMAAPVLKKLLSVADGNALPKTVAEACRLARSGEPGPVAIDLSAQMLSDTMEMKEISLPSAAPSSPQVDPARLEQLAQRLRTARRPLLLLGMGAMEAGQAIRQLAERMLCPVMTTCSGRGSIPEDDPLVVCPDFGMRDIELVNELVSQADLVLALGCKFTHNGSAGFRLRIPEEKLIHIDASAAVLNANYPASLAIEADIPALFTESAVHDLLQAEFAGEWTHDELAAWRRKILDTLPPSMTELPRLTDLAKLTLPDFFSRFRSILPRDAIIVTDSGFHQMLTRTFLPINAPRGIITPADFQAMDFGIPAAIGAALAAPRRRVVAVVGDGSMAMSAMELRTAVRERIPLTVIVLNDSSLGLIRRLQIEYYG